MQTILVEILELFLFSELLPTSVLELVLPNLRILLAHSNIGSSTSLDISRKRKLIAPCVVSNPFPRESFLRTSCTRADDNQVVLPILDEGFLKDLDESLHSPSSSIDLQSSFLSFNHTYEPDQVVIKLLQSLFYCDLNEDPTEQARRTIRARRIGSTLLSSTTALATVLLEEILPSILAAYRQITKEAIDEKYVRSAQLLAEIVGGCLVGLFHAGDEKMGERMIRGLKRILDNNRGNGSESAFDLFSSHFSSQIELSLLYPTIIATKP